MVRLSVSPGEDISGPLYDTIASGAHVVIPGGTYELSDPQALEASVSSPTTIEGDGMVTLDMGSQTQGTIGYRSNGTVLTYRNITLTGHVERGSSRMKPEVPNGGEVRLENFHYTPSIETGANVTGLMFDRTRGQNGTVYFDNGTIMNCGNNGIYHSQEENVRLVARGSHFENCNSDLIRVGGDNDLIEGCVFVMESAPPPVRAGETARTGRAIRMDASGSVTIHDNDFIYTWGDASSCIVTTDSAVNGSLDVSRNRFRHEGDHPVMRTDGSPLPALSGGGNHLTGSNTSVSDGFSQVVACAGSGCTPPNGEPSPPEDDGGDNGGDKQKRRQLGALAIAAGGLGLFYSDEALLDKLR